MVSYIYSDASYLIEIESEAGHGLQPFLDRRYDLYASKSYMSVSEAGGRAHLLKPLRCTEKCT